MDIVFLTALYWTGSFLSRAGYDLISGLIVICAAGGLYVYYCRRSGMLLDPQGLFSLAFIGGAGVSLLKLSMLQKAWSAKTFLCIYLAWLGFAAGSRAAGYLQSRSADRVRKSWRSGNEAGPQTAGQDGAYAGTLTVRNAGKPGLCRGADGPAVREPLPGRTFACRREIFLLIAALTLVSYAAFAVEALLLGYIPLFTVDTPHAYSYFHISGLHYFTVLCVLVPSLMVVYAYSLGSTEKEHRTEAWAALLFTAAAAVLPLLLVSRFQLIFAFALAGMSLLLIEGKHLKVYIKPMTIAAAAAAFALLVILYVFLSFERAHSVEYLNGIFEMKNSRMPIWITQPYIYIANNYDNLNCLIEELGSFAHGLRMLFPVIALSGLKFIRPELCAFPLYITKEELTTLTIVYDAYYDFGLPGVAAFTFVMGIVMGIVKVWMCRAVNTENVKSESYVNPVIYIAAAQLSFYMLFSFFTTWFSNPATWFYLGVTVIMYLFVWYRMRRQKRTASVI